VRGSARSGGRGDVLLRSLRARAPDSSGALVCLHTNALTSAVQCARSTLHSVEGGRGARHNAGCANPKGAERSVAVALPSEPASEQRNFAQPRVMLNGPKGHLPRPTSAGSERDDADSSGTAALARRVREDGEPCTSPCQGGSEGSNAKRSCSASSRHGRARRARCRRGLRARRASNARDGRMIASVRPSSSRIFPLVPSPSRSFPHLPQQSLSVAAKVKRIVRSAVFRNLPRLSTIFRGTRKPLGADWAHESGVISKPKRGTG
jgi:hypothetical protein